MVASTEKKTTKNSDIQVLTFEKASQELEDIVRKLESGNLDLDAAMHLYARGNELKTHCEQMLAEAKLKVEMIVAKDGVIQTTNMESPS